MILESLQYATFHNFCIYLFLFIHRISRNVSVEFPAEFPPYVTVVWYLSLVKGRYYPGFVAFLDKEVEFETSKSDQILKPNRIKILGIVAIA